MASRSLRKQIANKIAALEQVIQNGKDPKAVESAEEEIMNLVVRYNLGLEDMIDIDDMVQEILNK